MKKCKKILVTGGSGLLGSKVAKAGLEKFEVIATYSKNPVQADYRLVPLDITRKAEVFKFIGDEGPDYVVHTAAMTDVDRCEDDRAEAMKINAGGTANVAEACREAGAKMVYISTDAVFDGRRGSYKEDDRTDPINYYGMTKLEGEKAVEKSGAEYIIARVSVLYGWNVKNRLNYVTWLLQELKAGRHVKVVTDQWNSPTFADNCARILLGLLENDKSGIYHASGSERMSRFEFAVKVAEIFGFGPDLMMPVKSGELKLKAKRPFDSSLNVDKITGDLGTKPSGVEESLRQMKKQYKLGIL
jgi:dTDP-4-dehydrorhamnose reductase